MTKKQLMLISSALAGCVALLYNGVQALGANGNGLFGEYFVNSVTASGKVVLKRVDANIAFNWGSNAPTKAVGANKFSVRWTGQVQTPVDGDYTFTTLSDDGVRVWIDGRLVIDSWTTHNPKWDYSPKVRLAGGRRYNVKVEYFDAYGEAQVGLYWMYPGISKPVLIPTNNLFATTQDDPPAPAPTPTPTPPPGPTGGAFTAPANLRSKGVWLTSAKRKTDQLFWEPVPGAVSYNVYQYDLRIGAGIKTTTYVVPPELWCSMTYTVTAVDANGNESIPSNNTGWIGIADPARSVPTVPSATPTKVTAVPDWNAGKPRVVIAWLGSSKTYTYNLYRDGKLFVSDIWATTYIDTTVRPGEVHSYYVKGVTPPGTSLAESAPSNSVSAVAMNGPINNGAIDKVKIVKVTPNDDSVMIDFEAVDKAVDYRAYVVSKPGSYKYSGGGLSLEMNGLEPGKRFDIVVEAVDKLGPFQKMDGFYGPGAMSHNGALNIATNGQGDPSNIPNVLARSETLSVQPQAVTLTGSQVFFDTFRNSQPFVQSQTIDPRIIAANGAKQNGPTNPYVRELQNDKWIVRNYWGDMDNSRVFIMSNHIMETLYDGGTPRTSIPMHNNNASLVMSPKATADISGGKVLHITFEMDPHFTNRRWCEVFVAAAGDPLLNPGKFEMANVNPTYTGRMLKWEIMDGGHNVQMYFGKDKNNLLIEENLTNGSASEKRRSGNGLIGLNGSPKDLDRRHRYDMYLSQNRMQIYEEGKLLSDKTMRKGVTLPFTNVSVYFVHQVYHTNNERPGKVSEPDAAYFANHRPYADERHWDNMGFEVLNAFPR